MLLRQLKRLPITTSCRPLRQFSSHNSYDDENQRRDELLLSEDLDHLPGGIRLDEIDKIMSDELIQPLDKFYPNLHLNKVSDSKPLTGHNLIVIQPWISYANFNDRTDPQLQLDECVSLGNTIHNWHVIDKRVVMANQLNRKQILGVKAFEELKETIHKKSGVSAVFFGVELLSAIQLATLERELKLAVYDRFTVVLNIFRQHAKTKEAKLQLALAELPYIRSHLREIHESSEYSSATESLKILIGGVGEKMYHQRLSILKRRESKLKLLLQEIRKQRDIIKKQRRKSDIPTVAIVGYTNCGKTSLIKYLTQSERLVPKDQLFATLDVSVHQGKLPSSNKVYYLDTVGFISRIPLLLIEAFSATLKDVQDSDLIVHLLDASHPDHRLQHITVVKALEALKVSKHLLETRLTVGNKVDLVSENPEVDQELPTCDMKVSVTNAINMNELVERIDKQLLNNLSHSNVCIRVENGGKKYSWLFKNSTIVECKPDESDENYLICRVIFSPAASGRYIKLFGTADILKGH